MDTSSSDLTTRFDEGIDVTRRSRQPLAELLYRRTDLSGRLAVFQQSVDDTARGESFDRRSVAAFLTWSPSRGPGFSADFRQDSNVADVSVFGRDVSNRRLELKAFYNRRYWAATTRSARTSSRTGRTSSGPTRSATSSGPAALGHSLPSAFSASAAG